MAAVAAYDMTAAEIVIGWFLLAATPLMYLGRMDGDTLATLLSVLKRVLGYLFQLFHIFQVTL